MIRGFKLKTKCPKCKGIGSVVVDYKECEACGGTGFEEDAFDIGNHFKGVNSNARAKFDLGGEEDIPCEACNGKGQVEVFEECPQCHGTGQINVCRDAASYSAKNMICVRTARRKGRLKK